MANEWWHSLSAEERIAHYKRRLPCECAFKPEEWPIDLREVYSFDPYSHTRHDRHESVHTPAGFFAGTCECNDCVNGTGLLGNDLDALRARQRKAKAKAAFSGTAGDF